MYAIQTLDRIGRPLHPAVWAWLVEDSNGWRPPAAQPTIEKARRVAEALWIWEQEESAFCSRTHHDGMTHANAVYRAIHWLDEFNRWVNWQPR